MKKYLSFFLFFISLISIAQESNDFSEEVDAIEKKYDTLWDATKNTIVFTGSSSVRLWKSLESSFPNHQIVNSGFGGSEASDLLQHSNKLIHRFQPKKVFIYEGDNDINAKKTPKQVLDDMQLIISEIHVKNPNAKIVLISAKPSLSRWHLKKDYKRLNRRFKKLGKRYPLVDFVDIWKPMLDGRKVKKDIFIDDGLHMNAKGYQIWYNVLKKYVEE